MKIVCNSSDALRLCYILKFGCEMSWTNALLNECNEYEHRWMEM